ncbi:CCDC90 family protein [Serratia symbiotica]|uniref:CCDC90 family protein n=1 Tax=Serratia symbiotica TaxID=138074 RepID=UPI002090CDE0|nr:CCDC90 family protein [Serratia symbiotica]USS95291.1 CCDC90 family protein [Serratia symbiotica]
MAQVAFDTLKFVETLETAGLPKEQAKAISLAVRESHEAVDVATKRDLEDVRKELSTEIANVRKEMEVRFDKVDAKFEKLGMQMTIRLGLMIGASVSIIAAILKM